MSYTRLFSLEENLYTPGSPVVIAAGALLKDSRTENVLAQLKLRNIGDKKITSVRVRLTTFDSLDRPLGEPVEKQYLDLAAGRNSEFGQKVPIPLPDNTIRSFRAAVVEVWFEDKTVWTGDGEAVWSSICGRAHAERQNIDMDAPADCQDEGAVEEQCITAEKKAEAECLAAKKVRKIAVIVIAAIVVCITVFLVITKVITPAAKYNEAASLMDSGKYEEAITAFEALDGYKDSDAQIDVCETAILDEEYAAAVALLDAGEYEEAITAFEALNGYKDSDAQIDACEKAILDAMAYRAEWTTIGNVVTFGTYEQDNNTSNGKEAIEWIVLDVDGDDVLVISECALDVQPYDEGGRGVTWETCTLRAWLNGTFYNAAFSAAEQSQIQTTTVTADKNPEYSTSAGNDTQDRVFLLSVMEAEEYFTSNNNRRCVLTDYTIAQGAYTSGSYSVGGAATCCWWLRSPGCISGLAAYVFYFGSFVYFGGALGDVGICVRPALWIHLDS